MMVIQRSSNFADLISAHEPTKIQQRIRQAVDEYDKIPCAPSLLLPHADPESRSWKMYALRDDNERIEGKCPLHMRDVDQGRLRDGARPPATANVSADGLNRGPRVESVSPPSDAAPHVVIIDPSTGLSAFSAEFGQRDVGLILVETERTDAYPDYFGSAYKDHAKLRVRCDVSEVDATVARLQRDYNICAVCAGDETALAEAERGSHAILGARANDPATTSLRRHKYAMNETLARQGLRVPRQLAFNLRQADASSLVPDLAEFQFPVILKPNLSAGSVCTQKCESLVELDAVLERVKREFTAHELNYASEEFVLQEYLSGTEYLVDSFSHAGEHFVTGIFNYTKWVHDGVPVYQSVNFDGIGEMERAAADYATGVLDILGNRTGMVNTDLFHTKRGFALLEVNCRIVGFSGWVARLERHLFDYNQATLQALATRSQLETVPRLPHAHGKVGSVVLLQSPSEGVMRSPDEKWLQSLASYVEAGWFLSPGQNLRRAKSFLTDTVGAVVLVHDSPRVLKSDYAALIAKQNSGELF